MTFANQRLGNLRVFKYEDLDGDGQREAGEGPVQGITVTVRYPDGVTNTRLTGADGYISWNAIPVGSYRVTETLPANWRAILPASVAAQVNFQRDDGGDVRQPAQEVLYLSAAPVVSDRRFHLRPPRHQLKPRHRPRRPHALRFPTRPPIDIPGLQHPKGIAVDLRTHRLYVASRNTNVVYEVDPKTVPATVVRRHPGRSRAVWCGGEQRDRQGLRREFPGQ